jgi:hypothetical protein
MKFTNIKTVLSSITIGVIAAALIAACGSRATEAEPQIVVVTATPTATPNPVTYTVEATPTAEPPLEPTAEVAAEPTSIVYEAGTLLKGSGDGVFYLTEDGTRQHIYNWDTFLAFGFAQEDIVIVDDKVLEAIPLEGELTRLVFDEHDDLYWIMEGKLWWANRWKGVVSQEEYGGLLASRLDGLLKSTLPMRSIFDKGTLLRDGGPVYYFDYPALIPVPVDLYDETEVVDVPSGVLAVYEQKAQLEKVNIRLNADTQAANVRQGSSLEHEVIGVVRKNDRITALGRTADGNWLLIDYGDQVGWLASDLVEPSVALSLLPTSADLEAIAGDLPEAQPAAVTEKSEPQPIYCDDTPIRGFGKVWGDHLDVQNTLGCPYGGEQGTKAAVQTFQHGLMLWLESDSRYRADPVYVFFNDGNYQRFGDLGAADPAKVGTVPAGFHPVGDKFSKVYWEGTGVRVKERLGYATSELENTAGAFQQFSRGRMFWAEALDRIFVIYDYYYYDDDDNYIRVRTWASYEDTF